MRFLDMVPCICYSVKFRKDKDKDVLVLLDSGNKVNTMTPAYAAHLGLKMRVTNINTQKIDGFSLATYNMVIAAFQVLDKLSCSHFFQETFLPANIKMEVVPNMFFLPLTNADV